MKLFSYTQILLFSFIIIYPMSSQAQDITLENSSQIFFLDKIPSKLSLIVDKENFDLSKEEILTWVKEEPALVYNPKYVSEIENINICLFNKSLICRLTLPYKNQSHIQKVYSTSINQKLVENFIKDLSGKTNKNAEDAKFKIENEKVETFALSKTGFRLDEKKSTETLKKYLSQENFTDTLKLPFEIVQPETSSDSINNLGIISLIGEGRSNFKGSPKNRIFNINVATNRFNGVLIKPQEDFSFVKILGEVDGEHGYLPELVIKHDKTEPEFGGGICQVSTTAFRAAINSGLKITARRNHAYPVSYYNPQGMDSTVYVPKPDLRFLNDTPSHILIQTRIEGTELIFSFYGTSDGRRVTIIGPKITERKPDGSLKATFTQQIFGKDDQLIREEVFNSAYASPNKYPHPGEETKLTQKPKDWSSNEWNEYKKANDM